MEEATIRPVQSEGLQAVQAVAKVAWHATFAGHIPEADIESFLERNYSQPGTAWRRLARC